jgi:hypothetical protein
MRERDPDSFGSVVQIRIRIRIQIQNPNSGAGRPTRHIKNIFLVGYGLVLELKNAIVEI